MIRVGRNIPKSTRFAKVHKTAYYSHMEQPYTPDPFKNFTPRQNPVNQAVSAATEPAPINDATIALLEVLPKEELIALIKRVAGAMWGVGMMRKEEIAEAFKLKLAISGIGEKDMFKALPIMREWFDRELGKASQSIAMTVEDKGLGKLSDTRLLRLERELSRMTGEEAIIISPEPKKLEE